MISSFQYFYVFAFLATALAAPIQTKRSSDITAEQLIQISPGMASCQDAKFPYECRTAEQAAPLLNDAFSAYGISNNGEKAAILSLLLLESGNFTQNINRNPPPGNPGQGTRNMMGFNFVYQYTVDTPETSVQALALVKDASDPNISNATKNAVRELVLPDRLSFASGMWFYKASGPEKIGCTGNQTIVDGLQAATEEGWENYIKFCVFTTVTDLRKTLWEKTLSVL